MSLLAPTLQAIFTDRLIHQRDASPRTIKAYRDTFRLLLRFIEQQTGKQPFQLDLADIDAPLIGAFLTHLEHDRANSPRTRNAGSQRSTRSASTPRSDTPNTPPRSPE